MKKSVVLISVLMLGAAVQAAPYGPGLGYMRPPAPPRAAHLSKGPAAVANKGLDKLLSFLQKGAGDLKALAAFLDKEIAPYFDFAYMARAAAGRFWQRMNEGQRKRLAARIKRQFLTTMVERLGEYDRQQVRVVSQRLSPDGRVGIVTAAIRGTRGYPARLDFRFYRSKHGWKVYDVMANGQSAVVHYRQQFRDALYRRRAPRRSY